MAVSKIKRTSFSTTGVAPTISSNKFDNLVGGYHTKDRFTIVNLKIEVVATFSANDYYTAFSGFPAPYMPASLSVSCGSQGAIGATAIVLANGQMQIQSGATPLTNKVLYVTGCYVNA